MFRFRKAEIVLALNFIVLSLINGSVFFRELDGRVQVHMRDEYKSYKFTKRKVQSVISDRQTEEDEAGNNTMYNENNYNVPKPGRCLLWTIAGFKLSVFVLTITASELNLLIELLAHKHELISLKIIAAAAVMVVFFIKLFTWRYDHVYIQQRYKRYYDDPLNGLEEQKHRIFRRSNLVSWLKMNTFRLLCLARLLAAFIVSMFRFKRHDKETYELTFVAISLCN